MNLSGWQTKVESTASVARINYPDANRSPGGYNATLGGQGTTDAYLAQARTLSSTAWRPQLLAAAATDYIKSGYSGQRIDSVAPNATLVAVPLTAGGAKTYTFTVTYTDDNQINAASLGNGDLAITGPNGYNQLATLVSAIPSADGSTDVATYSVPAPANGAWSAAANGSYGIASRAGEVTDKVGNPVPAGSIGTFSVNINASAPTAAAVVTDVISPTTPVTLKVTYASTDGGIQVSSLDSNDLVVTATDGVTTTAARFVSADTTTNGTRAPRPTSSTRRTAGGTSATTASTPSPRRRGRSPPRPAGNSGRRSSARSRSRSTPPTSSRPGPTSYRSTRRRDDHGRLLRRQRRRRVHHRLRRHQRAGRAVRGRRPLDARGRATGAGTPADPLIARYSLPAAAGLAALARRHVPGHPRR